MNQKQRQGFSSQEQINLERVQGHTEDLIEQHDKQRNRSYDINPAEQIKKKQYSLEPDMFSGWKPKTYIPKPIPLIFYNYQLDYAIDILIKMKIYKHENSEENQAFIQLVYLGPRYQSTYSAWYQKPFTFPYTHLNKNKRLKFTDREFVGQYWNAQTENHLHFDSFFESGNLDVVFKIGEQQYDLFMRVDSNTRGHLHWYNFKVKNMKKGGNYKFNICNFLKGKSLYTRGMKPFIFSTRRYQAKNISWRQQGQKVKYEKKTPKSFRTCKIEVQQKPYRLSFQFQCQYQGDQVQFSYCIPYQYSRLRDYIQCLQKKCAGKNFLKVSRLTFSLGGLSIPILTITSNSKQTKEKQNINKKLIFASGRIHPGQSNGSFMMQGFIQYLCADTQESKNLRDSIVFKLVPMINPDGVVVGNYRTSLSGKDLNRQFISPDEQVFPQIYHLKKCIWKLRITYKKDFLMYLDFHGHSTKKNCFTYGPEFPITNNNYYQCRIFPKLISMQTQMFRYFSCMFKISECKQKTLRALLLKYFQLDLVYTVQVSNGCFYDHEQIKDVLFDEGKWLDMGKSIGKGINQYVMILKQLQLLKKTKKQQKVRIRKNKQKAKLKTALYKRQNKLFSRDKLTMSATKAPYNLKLITQPDSISFISPLKNKKLGYPNNSSGLSQKDLSFNQKYDVLEEQNVILFPQLKDPKIKQILKQIYTNKNNSKQNIQAGVSQGIQQRSNCSDDNISQGGSDSSSSSQDLHQNLRKQLFKSIKKGTQKFHSFHPIKRKNKQDENKQQKCDQKNVLEDNEGNEEQMDLFMTEMGNSANQLQDMQRMSKINSIKMNQLRSKRNIYLKKKSYQMSTTFSPKKQQKNIQTAKIVNFQFSLNPIKASNHPWHQKQQINSGIHSLYKQSSQQKLQKKIRQPPIIEYMTRNVTQITQNRSEECPQNFRKKLLSLQKQITTITSIPTGNKRHNMTLLRKTQERRPIINATFYKNLRPSRNIQEDNLKGQRMFSSEGKQKCPTQANQY